MSSKLEEIRARVMTGDWTNYDVGYLLGSHDRLMIALRAVREAPCMDKYCTARKIANHAVEADD